MRVMLLLFVAMLAACAQTNFQVYEGRSDQLTEGSGGTKEVIEGFDVWDNGTPPRRYQVIGVSNIEDFDNPFGNARMKSALPQQIRQAGGDAAIVMGGWTQGQSVGSTVAFGPGGSMAFGTSQSMGRKQIKYQIVKYLDKR